jgi:hypothetical protein
MSFLDGIFGFGQLRLSYGLRHDLRRLKAVAKALGESEATMPLKGLAPSDQVHRINEQLGQRLFHCAARERAAVAGAFAAADSALPRDVRQPDPPTASAEAASALETGCASLGRTLTDRQLAEIHAHLATKHPLLCLDAHMAAESVASLADVPAGSNYACYEYLDLWSSPHLLELAAEPRLLDLAQAYLGCAPTLYSINAFWSFPDRQPHPYSQLFHRDWEDYRSLVAFTLLTPVDAPEEGAHYYVETSHEVGRFERTLAARGVGRDDVETLLLRDGTAIAPVATRLFEGHARRFDGPAGTSFCGDGYGLHRAVVPRSRPRLLLWFRFGNFFNQTMYKIALRSADRAAARSVLRRIPRTARHRYVFRYLIEALDAV